MDLLLNMLWIALIMVVGTLGIILGLFLVFLIAMCVKAIIEQLKKPIFKDTNSKEK